MKFLILFHLFVSLAISAAIAYWHSTQSAVAFAAGAGVAFLNVVALVFTWSHIFEKKLVALSIGVIVFKFAILGWIIYEVVTKSLFPVGWFSAGLGVVILSTVATSLQYARQNPPEKVEE